MMNYTFDGEYELFEKDPVLKQVKDRIESRSNGKIKFAGYLNTRVKLKNDELELMKMDPNDPAYKIAKLDYEKRRQAYLEAEAELEGPMNALEKFDNAKGVVTKDPFEKAIDVVKNFLNGNAQREENAEEGANSQKPSLWNIFWR